MDCKCKACTKNATPLPREKWTVGRRVAYTWHRDETAAGIQQPEPLEILGTIVPRPKEWTKNTDGIMFSPDHLWGRVIWIWDFEINKGGANTSPVYETDLESVFDTVKVIDKDGNEFGIAKELVK